MLLCFLPNWSFAGGTSCMFSIVLFASHHLRVFPSLEIGLKCTLTVPLTTENWSLSTRRMSSNPAALTAASAFRKYLSSIPVSSQTSFPDHLLNLFHSLHDFRVVGIDIHAVTPQMFPCAFFTVVVRCKCILHRSVFLSRYERKSIPTFTF